MNNKSNDYSWLWKMLLGASINVAAQGMRKKLNNKNVLATVLSSAATSRLMTNC